MQSHRAEEVADAPCVELQVDGVNDEVAQERVEQDADGFTTRFTTGFTLLTSFYLVLPLVLPGFRTFSHVLAKAFRLRALDPVAVSS